MMSGVVAAPSHEGKTIVIAVDNPQVCVKAVDFVKHSFPQGYRYVLLHVQTKPPGVGDVGATQADDLECTADEEREVTSESFLEQVLKPQAAEGGAEVATAMLHISGDGSSAVGAAISHFLETHRPAALAIMKENKSSLPRLFVGSVTRYCAVHSCVPVIIIPE